MPGLKQVVDALGECRAARELVDLDMQIYQIAREIMARPTEAIEAETPGPDESGTDGGEVEAVSSEESGPDADETEPERIKSEA